MEKRILVIGSVNADVCMVVKRMPRADETFVGDSYSLGVGGKGANAAVAVARAGGSVGFVGCVGNDANGPMLLDCLKREGVDARFVTTTDDYASGMAAVFVEEGGKNRILVFPEANMHIPRESMLKAFEEPWGAVMMQLEIPHSLIIEAVREGSKRGLVTVLDAGPACAFPLEEIHGITILSPNETEAEFLTGMPTGTMEEAEAVCRELHRRAQAKFVVLKMGARGAMLFDGNTIQHFPAYAIDAVDPTAAGDAFTGALVMAYLECGDMPSAIRHANAVGALTATKLGAMSSLPTREEVTAFCREREKTV